MSYITTLQYESTSPLTLGVSDLADSGLLLHLGVRLRHDEGKDANSSEENGDLHSDDWVSDLLIKCVMRINAICRCSHIYLILHHKYGQVVASYIHIYFILFRVRSSTGYLERVLSQLFSWLSSKIMHMTRTCKEY